jgi:predicted RNA binding protein YcfA (HicA-like mRNA interferase family)
MTDVGKLVHLLRNTPVKNLIRALERAGFDRARSTAAGSLIYKHPDGRLTVVHYHRASDTLTRKTLGRFLEATR